MSHPFMCNKHGWYSMLLECPACISFKTTDSSVLSKLTEQQTEDLLSDGATAATRRIAGLEAEVKRLREALESDKSTQADIMRNLKSLKHSGKINTYTYEVIETCIEALFERQKQLVDALAVTEAGE